MNREEIEKILPHRAPMLLVDEAETTGPEEAWGKYTIRGDEFFLQGHFPGNPVVPGVILCEMMAQACCVLLAGDPDLEGATPFLTKLDGVKFKNPVLPGDAFETRCKITRRKGPFVFAESVGSVNGKESAKATYSFALVKNDKE